MAGLRWTHMISFQEVAEEGKSPYVREIQVGEILCTNIYNLARIYALYILVRKKTCQYSTLRELDIGACLNPGSQRVNFI